MTAPVQAGDSSKALGTYLRPEELADLLQVSSKTVYRWAQLDPSMPVLRIGAVVRFPKERVLAWLRTREQGLSGRRQSRKQMRSGTEGAPLRVVSEPDPASCAQVCAHEGPK